jgi:phasin family protein
MVQPTEYFVEPYKQGLQLAADVVNLALTSASRLHEQQLKTINEITSASAETIKLIQSTDNLPELMAHQQVLLRAYVEKTLGCWSGLYEVAGRNHIDALKRVQDGLIQATDDLRKIASTAPKEAAPALAAFQSMMDAARQVYAVTAKTAEDFSRSTAAQIENASSAARAQSGKAAHPRPSA